MHVYVTIQILILWCDVKDKKYESRVRYFILMPDHTEFRNAALTN